MTCIENRHFDLNRSLLLVIGLWPYQQSNLIRLQLILLFSVLMSFIIFQLSKLIIVGCTFDFVIKMLSSMLFYIMFAIKYNSFWINSRTVKYLLDQLQYICEGLKDENEIAILEKYSNNAKYFTAKMILIGICGVFLLVSLTCSPHILDIIIPKNRTRTRHFIEIVGKFYAVQERYFFLITLYMNIACCIGAITLIATGTIFITFLKQACGMFKIASYRIERVMMIHILENINLKNEAAMYRGLICAVDIHRKAMEFTTFFVSNFEGSFFFLIIVTVSCLSLNLFQIFQMLSHAIEMNEFLILHMTYVIVSLLYMFLANYAGQEITDHNNYIFLTAYNVQWYEAPLHVQKLILFLLQRGKKVFSLNIGGLFVASLECFLTLASASLSYFTVMYSTQQ